MAAIMCHGSPTNLATLGISSSTPHEPSKESSTISTVAHTALTSSQDNSAVSGDNFRIFYTADVALSSSESSSSASGSGVSTIVVKDGITSSVSQSHELQTELVAPSTSSSSTPKELSKGSSTVSTVAQTVLPSIVVATVVRDETPSPCAFFQSIGISIAETPEEMIDLSYDPFKDPFLSPFENSIYDLRAVLTTIGVEILSQRPRSSTTPFLLKKLEDCIKSSKSSKYTNVKNIGSDLDKIYAQINHYFNRRESFDPKVYLSAYANIYRVLETFNIPASTTLDLVDVNTRLMIYTRRLTSDLHYYISSRTNPKELRHIYGSLTLIKAELNRISGILATPEFASNINVFRSLAGALKPDSNSCIPDWGIDKPYSKQFLEEDQQRFMLYYILKYLKSLDQARLMEISNCRTLGINCGGFKITRMCFEKMLSQVDVQQDKAMAKMKNQLSAAVAEEHKGSLR